MATRFPAPAETMIGTLAFAVVRLTITAMNSVIPFMDII
jgi:hypothetical protein